jgi:hypothetical protein
MKTRTLVAVVTFLAFAGAGSLSYAQGDRQQEPPKKGRAARTSPMPSETTTQNQGGGALGGLNETPTTANVDVITQVDSMMQQMTMLKEKAQSYAKSFGVLAAVHHGTDKSEILMMQRMSDSMGMIAAEIEVSLRQYKEMLNDETASESGGTKAEVLSFTDILYGIAGYINGAVNTLQTLQERLGQG